MVGDNPAPHPSSYFFSFILVRISMYIFSLLLPNRISKPAIEGRTVGELLAAILRVTTSGAGRVPANTFYFSLFLRSYHTNQGEMFTHLYCQLLTIHRVCTSQHVVECRRKGSSNRNSGSVKVVDRPADGSVRCNGFSALKASFPVSPGFP